MRYLIGAIIGVGLLALAFAGIQKAKADTQLLCIAEADAAEAAKAHGQRAIATAGLSVGGAMLITGDDQGGWTLWVAPKPGLLCPLLIGNGWQIAKPEAPS